MIRLMYCSSYKDLQLVNQMFTSASCLPSYDPVPLTTSLQLASPSKPWKEYTASYVSLCLYGDNNENCNFRN